MVYTKRWVVRRSKGDLEAVFACFVEQYERRYRRKARWSSRLQATIKGNLFHLVKLEGREVAEKSVIAVFTHPKLRWVTTQDLFLSNCDNFTRFVVPIIDERGGEQSEWSGPRDTKPGSETLSPQEFFYGGRS